MPGQPTTSVLDLQRFAASTLANSEGLAVALKVLQSCLAGPDVPLVLIVQDLCSVPNLFEFIVSASPNAQGLMLVRRILDAYPAHPALVETSCAGVLLRRLSSVLSALPACLFPSDNVRDKVVQNKVYVENALAVLVLFYSTEFSYFDLPRASFVPDREHGHLRHENQNAFRKLGVEVPADNADASRTAREISNKLNTILRFYLDLILEPSFAQQLRRAYISTDAEAASHSSAPQGAGATETPESDPSTRPNGQPLNAVLSFNNANKFGDWRIIVSTNATRRLCELANSDRKKCHEVVNKMRHLSKGRFSGENHERLNGPSGVPIFEAKVQRDLHLVYQIDVIPDHEEHVERQVVKVYGIYTHTPLSGIWDVIGQHLATKGGEYRKRCALQTPVVHCGRNVYLPACFPPGSLQNNVKQDSPVLSDEDMAELHTLLVLEKYATFSQAFLNSLIANRDVEHLFELTPEERRIVECATSCYVLGRSGTGKTTTMIVKMLGIQHAWEEGTTDIPKPRQIFVTKSRRLATKVREYFTGLLDSLVLAGYSLEDLKKIQTRSTKSGRTLIGDDDDDSGNPQPYSTLGDDDFPLFVTFDTLVKMVAADMFSDESGDPEARHFARFFINTDEARVQDSFVTYDVFARAYWPHFPQTLTKGLDPWLVFSEFMGIIKGSEKSLSCPDGFLDEDAYCSLSARSSPTFANQRQTLHAIFKAYCKIKKQRRHHDVADRTHAILKTILGGTSLKGQRVDYLYIDEAQDNLLIDALLLRLICRNPEGLFWAGDTAQTISAGSSFRFNDLKAFVYRIERARGMHLIQGRPPTDPTMFQLATNYRSHGGIVKCARSVIERITHFWPDAIDVLLPELGIVEGPKPWFFRDWDHDTLKQFLCDKSGSRVELGARQCILVRNDAAVKILCKELEVEEIDLIMTIYDSKGLEFDDVLLYNFFEDSAIDASRWRVLLNHLEGTVDGQNLAKVYAPPFGRDELEGRYAGLCSEMKLLYVGITRARKRLWILDKSERSEAMRMIWTSRYQVQSYMPGMDAPRFSAFSESTPAEWESFGHDLFENKKYRQAMHCFGQASLPCMVTICEAFHLRQVARAQVDVAPQKAQQYAFLVAANAFVTVASRNDVPHGREKLQYYRNAADCFVRAGNDRKAAIAYLEAEEFDTAARRFRNAGLFDKTLEVLHKYSINISSSSLAELHTVCRLFFCRKGVRPHVPLFSSSEEEEKFLKDYDLNLARTTFLENHGRYLDAAELHLSEDRPLNAIRNFLKEKNSPDAIQRATGVVLDGLWRRCSFGITRKNIAADDDVCKLLKLASELPVDSLDPLDGREISMFRAIARADLPSLKRLSLIFLEEKRNAAALLALDHCFARLPILRIYSLQEMSVFLDEFQKYVRLLHYVISHPDPLSDVSIKRLFWIKEMSNTDYRLESGSILYSSATGGSHTLTSYRASIITLSKKEMVRVLRKYLAAHLYERAIEENKLCSTAQVFSQCLTFIVNGLCNRVDCPQDHVRLADLDTRRYNLRISTHLQQICILQVMFSVRQSSDRQNIVLSWLSRLYEAFNPQFHVQGSIADLDLSMISGAQASLGIMKEWVRDALYALRADQDRSAFLTNVFKLTSLIFTFDGSSALRCITQAPFNARQARVDNFVYAEDQYLLEDIVRLFDGTQQTCISAGLSFLRHVLKSALSVDLSILCDCLEEVVGKISISWGLSSSPPLDGLVLPRSWILSNKDFSGRKDTRIVLIVDVLDHLRDLLIALQSSHDDPNRIYSLSRTKLTPTLCNVFIARICRALGLLCHNVRNHKVRDKIKSIFDTLGTARALHILYRKYVQARANKYLGVMVHYDTISQVVIEDLVQLIHRERDLQRFAPLTLRRIRPIQFADPSEIPTLLASQLAAARTDHPADAPAFVSPADDFYESQRTDNEESEEPEAEVEFHEEPEELPPALDEPVLSREHVPTHEEILAARKIKTAYRMYRKHREAQTRAIGKGMKAQRNRVFIECLKNVYAARWARSPYRTIYLWALPHLVVCLDKAVSLAHKAKKETTRLLLQESHERFEVLGKKMTMINALLKDGHDLRRMIEPNATMHRDRDEDKMKKAVLDVEDFVRRLPIPTPDSETRDSLRIAHELVMVEKKPVSQPEKPTLNTEDL